MAKFIVVAAVCLLAAIAVESRATERLGLSIGLPSFLLGSVQLGSCGKNTVNTQVPVLAGWTCQCQRFGIPLFYFYSINTNNCVKVSGPSSTQSPLPSSSGAPPQPSSSGAPPPQPSSSVAPPQPSSSVAPPQPSSSGAPPPQPSSEAPQPSSEAPPQPSSQAPEPSSTQQPIESSSTA